VQGEPVGVGELGGCDGASELFADGSVVDACAVWGGEGEVVWGFVAGGEPVLAEQRLEGGGEDHFAA
jgi:hypothetical protein